MALEQSGDEDGEEDDHHGLDDDDRGHQAFRPQVSGKPFPPNVKLVDAVDPILRIVQVPALNHPTAGAAIAVPVAGDRPAVAGEGEVPVRRAG